MPFCFLKGCILTNVSDNFIYKSSALLHKLPPLPLISFFNIWRWFKFLKFFERKFVLFFPQKFNLKHHFQCFHIFGSNFKIFMMPSFRKQTTMFFSKMFVRCRVVQSTCHFMNLPFHQLVIFWFDQVSNVYNH